MSDSRDPEDYDLGDDADEDIEDYESDDEGLENLETEPYEDEEDEDEELTAEELSEERDVERKERVSTSEKRRHELLTEIDGVGSKTAEKLIKAGFDEISKIASASPEVLMERVADLSLTKAQNIIASAKSLLEEIEEGESSFGITKRLKRKKSAEAEIERIRLPPTSATVQSENHVRLIKGLDIENREIGVRIGPRILTKFERARIVGARALQISMGAPPLIDTQDIANDLFTIAERELKAGMLPMTVRRTLPTGEYEDIPLSVLLKYTRLV